MDDPRLGRIVTHAVMTLGEKGNPVHPRLVQHVAKCIGIEFRPHISDQFGGVEIEMDLPESRGHQIGPRTRNWTLRYFLDLHAKYLLLERLPLQC